MAAVQRVALPEEEEEAPLTHSTRYDYHGLSNELDAQGQTSVTSCALDKDVHDHDLLLPSLQGCAQRPGLPGSQTACQVYLVSDSAGVGCDVLYFFLVVVIWRRSTVLVFGVE